MLSMMKDFLLKAGDFHIILWGSGSYWNLGMFCVDFLFFRTLLWQGKRKCCLITVRWGKRKGSQLGFHWHRHWSGVHSFLLDRIELAAMWFPLTPWGGVTSFPLQNGKSPDSPQGLLLHNSSREGAQSLLDGGWSVSSVSPHGGGCPLTPWRWDSLTGSGDKSPCF